MKDFTPRTPLNGWTCNHCGHDTYEPGKHAAQCLSYLRAEVKRLREAIKAFVADQGWANKAWINQAHIKPLFEIAKESHE